MKLEIRHLTKSFGTVEVLKDITFATESGRAMGFLGRNGAGKTTTMRCLMNVFRQDSGEILLDGVPFRARSASIGYLPEERGLYAKEPILDQLVYFAMLRGMKKASATQSALHWLERVELSGYKKKRLEILSKGNQQKVQIIQAFLTDPDILILDEPFSGLDPVNAQVFKDIILEQIRLGKLVLFSSHQMAYVEEFCDDIALIHNGRIVLTGDLHSIRKERAERQLLIEGTGESLLPVLSRYSEEPPRQVKNAYQMKLKQACSKEELLSVLLAEGVKIDALNDYLPSLNSIFLESVGER